MRHNRDIREKAIELRATTGASLNELASELGVARSTLQGWVKGVALPDSPLSEEKLRKQRARQQAATQAMQRKYAALRTDAYEAAYCDARMLLEDRELRDFVVLYLAEGYRKDRNSVSFTNSNPTMIKFAHMCMRKLAENRYFRYNLQYHQDQDPEALRASWAALLAIDAGCINLLRKSNSGRLTGRRFACEFGIFQIQVSDTLFRSRLQALMDVVQEEWASS
jgi:transposase-like protein